MLPYNSAFENDSQKQTRLHCWSEVGLEYCLRCCCWEVPLFACFIPCILVSFYPFHRHTTQRESLNLLSEFQLDNHTQHFVTSSLALPTTLPPPLNRDRWTVPWACGLPVTNEWSAIVTCNGGQKKDEELWPEEMTQTRSRLKHRQVQVWPCPWYAYLPLTKSFSSPHFCPSP